MLLTVLILVGCKKSDNPSPSVNNNPGGDTIINDNADCDTYYENVRYHGKQFKLVYYLPCTSLTYNDSLYGQLLCGKKYYDNYYTFQPIYKTGGMLGYDKYNKYYTNDPDFMPKASFIINEVNSKGKYRISEVMDDNEAYNHIDTSVHVGYYLKAYGYDPDTQTSYGGRWSMNIPSTDEFYYEITSIHHLYDNYYEIEGSKNLLLVYYNGIDGLPHYDTLQSTFKIALPFNQ